MTPEQIARIARAEIRKALEAMEARMNEQYEEHNTKRPNDFQLLHALNSMCFALVAGQIAIEQAEGESLKAEGVTP